MTAPHFFPASPVMLGLLLGFAQINAEELPAGIIPNKRQAVGTGVTSSSTTAEESSTMSSATSTPPSSSSTPDNTPSASESQAPATSEPAPTTNVAPTSTTIPTTIQVTTTNADGSAVTSAIRTSTAVPTTNSSGKSSEIVDLGSTTINRSTLSSAVVVTAPLVTSRTEASTYTSTFTVDGSTFVSTGTTQRVIASTTGFATSTIAPSIQNSSSGGGGGGLSSSSQKIIGGVVGGIGGAILVGGVAIVAWRIWGKKKAQREAAMDPFYQDSQNDSVGKSSPQMASGTGLERYQQPHHAVNPGSVNAASNF